MGIVCPAIGLRVLHACAAGLPPNRFTQHVAESTYPLQASYDLFRRTVAALPPGPLHAVVLSGIPLIFPKARGSHADIRLNSFVDQCSGAARAMSSAMWQAAAPNSRHAAGLQFPHARFERGAVPAVVPAQVPAAETLLGCMGRVTRSVPALKNAARSSGETLPARCTPCSTWCCAPARLPVAWAAGLGPCPAL